MIFHRRDNNKPPLRADPAATLKHHSDQMSGRLRRGLMLSSGIRNILF
ncbi:hypothetical protein FOFC_18370 [Fusarium oxysporum]|nr:hypothetical protein FOFC_18370 [Fusarium oxysporum]